jgi:hypothetical protein
MPDALGFVVDKRGDFWAGPCNVGYSQVTGDAAGESFQYWAPMYKWNMPGLHSNGVRLGNGWSRPDQNRLKNPLSGGTAGVHFDVGVTTDSEMCGWGRPNTTAYDPVTDKLYVVGIQMSNTEIRVALYWMSLDPAVVASQGGQYRWVRESLAPLPLQSVGVSATVTSNADWLGDRKNANVSNVAVVNGALYFSFVQTLGVTSGGNYNSTTLRKSWILSVDLTSKAVGWVPYPAAMDWWLRTWDGPLVALGAHPLTTAQYRSLKGVGNKLVLGPDAASHNVTRDPWICVYDTVSKAWTLFDVPANYSLTNGGHDWPNSIFSLVAMPSVGEVWLAGQGAIDGTAGDADDTFRQDNGLHNPKRFQSTSGQWTGRRIIRFKVT